MKIVVHGVQCPRCRDVIFSRTRHDYRKCGCTATAIDGGQDYMRVGYNPEIGSPVPVVIELINLTLTDLHADWNGHFNKFGRITTKFVVYDSLYRYTLNNKGKFRWYPKHKGAV